MNSYSCGIVNPQHNNYTKGHVFSYAAADEGERHRGGGMVGEVEGYLWMGRRAAAVGGCDKRGGGGGEGWGSNAEAEMVCRVSLPRVLC